MNIILFILLFLVLKVSLIILAVKKVKKAKQKKLARKERILKINWMIETMNKRADERDKLANSWDKEEIKVNYK